jgi:hypothetical protein
MWIVAIVSIEEDFARTFAGSDKYTTLIMLTIGGSVSGLTERCRREGWGVYSRDVPVGAFESSRASTTARSDADVTL